MGGEESVFPSAVKYTRRLFVKVKFWAELQMMRGSIAFHAFLEDLRGNHIGYNHRKNGKKYNRQCLFGGIILQ